MKTVKYLIVLFLITLGSCKEETNPVISQIDYGQLNKSWTNSVEEQKVNDPTQVFRPSDYKEFSTLRYREQLKFSTDSNCSYLVLAPNDGHYFANGKWNFVEREKNIIKIIDSTGVVYKIFQIIELNQDLLKYVVVN